MFPIAVQYRANNNKNDVVYKTHLVKEDTEIDGDDYIFFLFYATSRDSNRFLGYIVGNFRSYIYISHTYTCDYVIFSHVCRIINSTKQVE